MARLHDPMTLRMAREVLGVSSLCTPDEVRAAFRDAAKRAHPDNGGDPAAFCQVVAAYRRLQDPYEEGFGRPLAPAAASGVSEAVLEISPGAALGGGQVPYAAPNGRTLRITLPPGLRSGDRVRAAGAVLRVYVRVDAGVLVRGDDVWVTAHVPPARLKSGGRISVETPLGPRSVWIDRRAAERGLVRIEGEGLPARGRHPAGSLYVRLAPLPGAGAESAAMTLLRRFAAAWAA